MLDYLITVNLIQIFVIVLKNKAKTILVFWCVLGLNFHF